MNMRAVRAIVSLALVLLVSACGGGEGNSTSFTAPNEQAVRVGPGPTNNVNLLLTTVQICTPGSQTQCQSIDHVLVDTGSTGLRLLASRIDPSLALPQQTDAVGRPLAECGQFVSGLTWGPIKRADIRIAQELAQSAPIQIIADPGFAAVPSSCSGLGGILDSAQSLGANGVLGIGVFQHDCGTPCAQNVIPGTYYSCPVGGCQPTQASLALQMQNPVALFPDNNNGFVIDLPSVPLTGASSVQGSLIFGIGTQGNNTPGTVQRIGLNPASGTFSTRVNGVTYGNSFVDSGSNALYFSNSAIPACGSHPDFGCPASTLNFTATMFGSGGSNATFNFNVSNAERLFSTNPTAFAFSTLAGPSSDTTAFDWGLPFFFGRRVFIGIEGQDTPLGTGPYIAF